MKKVYLYVLPSLIFSFFWGFYPFIYSIYISVFDYTLYNPTNVNFIGARNYLNLFQNADFFRAFGQTLLYLAVCIVIELVVGLGIALLLSREFKGVSIFRTIATMPILLMPMGVTVIWKLMVFPGAGIINSFTQTLGWGTLNWLGDPFFSSLLVVLVEVWQWTPFVTLILLAAIMGLPKAPFEAAKVDGLPSTMVFTKITLPMLRPVMAVVVIIRSLDLLKLMGPVYGLTGGGSGTETLSYFIYRTSFKGLRIGWGGAISMVFWVIAFVAASLMVRRLGVEVD